MPNDLAKTFTVVYLDLSSALLEIFTQYHETALE